MYTLVLADVRNHLEVIVVANEGIGTWFNISAEFLVVYVYKIGFTNGCSGTWTDILELAFFFNNESLSHPLIPLGNHYNLWMLLMCLFPLLSEIVAVRSFFAKSIGIIFWLFAVMVTFAYLGIGMLGNAYRYLLIYTLVVVINGIIEVLGVIGQPWP